MAELFGIDIAQLIWDQVQVAGGLHDGTLTHQEPPTSGPDGFTRPLPTTHTFQGILEDRTSLIDGTFVPVGIPVLGILGASVAPLVIPSTGDTAFINEQTCTLGKLISKDPADAYYEFSVTYVT